MADALERALAATGLRRLYLPLGLFHSDHRLTSDAALRVVVRRPAWSWHLYEDAIYRRFPGLREERLAALAADGYEVGPVEELRDAGRTAKNQAVACYRSQIRALTAPGHPGCDDVFRPEWTHRLAPIPAGVRRTGPSHDRR
ncbi:MAG: hypothetical protein U0531_09215 [Dehalococcoidia bacterium]